MGLNEWKYNFITHQNTQEKNMSVTTNEKNLQAYSHTKAQMLLLL